MPGRDYMGIDYRPDHSFRIPRPDLTLQIGVPNACDRCHVDKTTAWSVEAMAKWYGKRQRPHYGTVLAEGRRQAPEAVAGLVRLAQDRLYPAIVRATALALLSAYPGDETQAALDRALVDEDALLRYTAVLNFAVSNPAGRIRLVGPLLYDPVKAVRIEAARNLVGVPPELMPDDLARKYQTVLAEYRNAMEYTADFAPSRHNLGNLAADLGQVETAVAHYRNAIDIDSRFYPARVNLAMLYNRMGKNAEAETLLRQVVAANPELYEIQYSLGLLLAERGKYAEAENHLALAAIGRPGRARIHYNLGLLRQQLGQDREAEAALQRASKIEPGNLEFLYALADFYFKRGRLAQAEQTAEKMIASHPQQRIGYELLELIRSSKPGPR
jgi:tetratricopeptide (TPR) repeat protein